MDKTKLEKLFIIFNINNASYFDLSRKIRQESGGIAQYLTKVTDLDSLIFISLKINDDAIICIYDRINELIENKVIEINYSNIWSIYEIFNEHVDFVLSEELSNQLLLKLNNFSNILWTIIVSFNRKPNPSKFKKLITYLSSDNTNEELVTHGLGILLIYKIDSDLLPEKIKSFIDICTVYGLNNESDDFYDDIKTIWHSVSQEIALNDFTIE